MRAKGWELMPLFACSQCGCVENTALARFWTRWLDVPPGGTPPAPLCSECDPRSETGGQWHHQFPKRHAAGMIVDARGFLHEGQNAATLGPRDQVRGIIGADGKEQPLGMRTPVTFTCDLCGAAIAHESRMIRINVPLTEDLKRRIREFLEKHPPSGPTFGGVLLLPAVPAAFMVPDNWTLETCGCVLGLLPMLAEVVGKDVMRIYERRAREKEGPKPIERLEDL